MSDDDLIRRGDALAALAWGDIYGRNAQAALAALPAVTPRVKQLVWEKEEDGSGWYAECPINPDEFYLADTLVEILEVEKSRESGILAALDMQPDPDAQAIREAALREAHQRVNDLVSERQADLHGARNDFNLGAVDALQEACSAILALIGTTAEGGA